MTGKVNGKNVTWTHQSDSQDGPVTVVCNGVLESDTEGEFSATRSK